MMYYSNNEFGGGRYDHHHHHHHQRMRNASAARYYYARAHSPSHVERDLVRVGLGVSVRVWVIVFRVRDEFVVGRRKCFGEFKVRGGRDWSTERRVAPSRERLVERRREKSHGEFSDVSKARRYVWGLFGKSNNSDDSRSSSRDDASK